MSSDRTTPLRVFYVCSNLAIAAQNCSRLISFIPKEERKTAVAEVDRPSLMPTQDPPTHKRVQVFSLTPATSIPQRHGRQRGGSFRERALGRALLDEIVPARIPRLHRTLRMNVGPDRFDAWAQYYRGRIPR